MPEAFQLGLLVRTRHDHIKVILTKSRTVQERPKLPKKEVFRKIEDCKLNGREW